MLNIVLSHSLFTKSYSIYVYVVFQLYSPLVHFDCHLNVGTARPIHYTNYFLTFNLQPPRSRTIVLDLGRLTKLLKIRNACFENSETALPYLDKFMLHRNGFLTLWFILCHEIKASKRAHPSICGHYRENGKELHCR